jgi:hypothetical protein
VKKCQTTGVPAAISLISERRVANLMSDVSMNLEDSTHPLGLMILELVSTDANDLDLASGQ